MNDAAARAYEPPAYPGRVVLLRSRGSGPRDLGWGAHLPGPVDVVEVPGHHLQMLAQPHITVLAERIRDLTDEVGRAHARVGT